jgi:hypothetical protein
MRIALMLIVALAQTDAENCIAERITFVTLRTERPRGGVGKSEDQRMSGERTGLGLTSGVAAGGRLNECLTDNCYYSSRYYRDVRLRL